MEKIKLKAERKFLKNAPTTIGVYIFEKKGKPLYIGKSVNLRARLNSHYEQAKIDPKSAGYVDNADQIKLIVTDSELKALLLESEQISKWKPKYNVRWRDDKSFLYIKATVKDSYPKFFITRREKKGDSMYFGPFQSVKVAAQILREIRKVFPFCTQKKITNQRCFYAKIKLCDPCPNVIEKIQIKSEKLKERRKYRKHIKEAIKVLKGNISSVTKNLYESIDILTKQNNFEEAIKYRDRLFKLESLVTNRRFNNQDPDYFNLSTNRIASLYNLLKKHLPKINELKRIECYDISNLSFKESTASMVVFTDGLSDKKEYKRFKIKNAKSQSDFEMIDEVIARRFKHKDWALPDLVVIDGGKPQVRTVIKALINTKVDIPLVGIAKRPDRLIISTPDLITVRPSTNHPGFRMIQSLRDESHRFAKKYHIQLRNQKML